MSSCPLVFMNQLQEPLGYQNPQMLHLLNKMQCYHCWIQGWLNQDVEPGDMGEPTVTAKLIGSKVQNKIFRKKPQDFRKSRMNGKHTLLGVATTTDQNISALLIRSCWPLLTHFLGLCCSEQRWGMR